jgi:hypothetical protein
MNQVRMKFDSTFGRGKAKVTFVRPGLVFRAARKNPELVRTESGMESEAGKPRSGVQAGALPEGKAIYGAVCKVSVPW